MLSLDSLSTRVVDKSFDWKNEDYVSDSSSLSHLVNLWTNSAQLMVQYMIRGRQIVPRGMRRSALCGHCRSSKSRHIFAKFLGDEVSLRNDNDWYSMM